MTTIKELLKLLALVLWFLAALYGGFTIYRRPADGSTVVFGGGTLIAGGLFCWHLADILV